MRHYIMHFWHQLPDTIQIDIDLMNSMDTYMYRLLCYIYLSLDNKVDYLKRINTIAYLMPKWLMKTFESISNDTWLVDTNQHLLDTVGPIKIMEANRWHYKIQFIIDLLATFQVLLNINI